MTEAAEIVKRREPTLTTVRRLFLYSGNQCAFPDCEHELIDEEGDFVAQTCHIAAAETGGPRFDAGMSNDERRAFDNLLLMCGKHHKKTDNVKRYPTEELRRIKTEHESVWKGAMAQFPIAVDSPEFADAVNDAIASAIEDPTDRITVKLPQTLDAFNAFTHGGSYEPWQLAHDLPSIHAALLRLRPLPVDTRKVFEIFMRQAEQSGDDLEMLTADLKHRVRPADDFDDHLDILERRRVLARNIREEFVRGEMRTREVSVVEALAEGDNPVWVDYRAFCVEEDVDPGTAIRTLDFRFLDGPA